MMFYIQRIGIRHPRHGHGGAGCVTRRVRQRRRDDVSDLGPFWVATDIAAADLDSDGRTDVVSVAMLANSGTQNLGYLRVYRQTSSWGFAFSQYLVGTYPWRVKIADIDGDAAADLLILDVGRSGASPGMVWLMRQDRRNRGVFLAPEVVAAGLSSTYDFAVIDADLDGAPDIVLASGIGGSDGAALLLQDPSQRGTFRPATLITFPGKPQAVGMGDLNGDGLPDLAFYATTSLFGGHRLHRAFRDRARAEERRIWSPDRAVPPDRRQRPADAGRRCQR